MIIRDNEKSNLVLLWSNGWSRVIDKRTTSENFILQVGGHGMTSFNCKVWLKLIITSKEDLKS